MVYEKKISSENPNKRKSKKSYTPKLFVRLVSHIIKIQNFNHQNWSELFV